MRIRWFRPRDDDLKARQDRRGRGAVLWGLAGVLLLQLAYYPLNDLWPQLHDAEYGTKLSALRAQLAAKHKDAPSVVMVGGSLTSWAFNPAVLTTVHAGSSRGPVAYNFGVNNARTVAQLLCLRRILADGIRPNLVLVDTYVWDFNTNANHMDGEVYFPVLRLQEADMEVIRRYDPQADKTIQNWALLHWTPWYSYRQNAQRYLLPSWVSPTAEQVMYWNWIDRNGWEYFPAYASSMRQTPRSKMAAAAVACAQWMNTEAVDETFSRAYRETAEACRNADVPLALVRMPEHSDLRAALSPAVRDKLDGFFAELAGEKGVQVIDARDWAPDDGFVDGFHLDAAGSTRFTQKLERDVLGPQVFHRREE